MMIFDSADPLLPIHTIEPERRYRRGEANIAILPPFT